MQKQNSLIRLESKVYSKGKTTLPIELKKYLGIKDGESVLYIQKGNDIVITTRRLLIERVQQIAKKSKVKYDLDDFINERRQEALDELED